MSEGKKGAPWVICIEILGKEIKTGIKETILLLIMANFICSCSSAASTTHLADNPSIDDYKGGRGIANQSKFGHGGGGGGRGGGEHGTTGGEANGDRSHNPTGGASVIPLYAAGANKHHPNNHHGGGDCRHGSITSAVLAAAILESLLLYIHKDF